MADHDATARQRKLERRRERRDVERQAEQRRATRNRWIQTAVLAVVFTGAIYAVLLFVWNPFPRP